MIVENYKYNLILKWIELIILLRCRSRKKGIGSLLPKCVLATEIRSSTSARSNPVSTIWLSQHIVSSVSLKASMHTSLYMILSKPFKNQMKSGPNFRKDMQPQLRMPRALMRKLKSWSATSRQRQSESRLLSQTYSNSI